MSAAVARNKHEFGELEKGLNRARIQKDAWWIYLTIFYIPIGLLLLVIRLCISVQALLMLLLLPNNFPLKRLMLRLIFAILGIVVLLNNKRRDSSVKVLVANKISSLDHLLFHLIINCISIYPKMDQPFIPYLLPRYMLLAKDDESWQREASKITVSSSLIVTQPEGVATNGKHVLLKYRAWPFVLDKQVQPVIIEAFRPINAAGLNISTVDNPSTALLDLLSCFYSPVTIFRIGYLPIVTQAMDETVQQFADRTQKVASKALNLKCTQFDYSDVQKWMGSFNRVALPMTAAATADNSSVPFIPISQFNKMIPQDPQLEAMIGQVSNVLPQVPRHVIQNDLIHTRDVDKTITNILEGRARYDSAPASSNMLNNSSTVTVAKRNFKNLSFPERKKAFIEEARRLLSKELKEQINDFMLYYRRFISKHGH